MNSDNNNQGGADDDKTSGGEGGQSEATIALKREEYDELLKAKSDYGSLRREFKDLKKSLESRDETKETPQNQTDNALMQKTFLRAAGITDSEEVELAISTAKKWGVDVDSLVDDDDFKLKLEKVRSAKSNEMATSGIKGSGGSSGAKNDPAYWMSLGRPPTREEVTDRKTRATIARAMMAKEKGGSGTFYND